MSAQIQPNPSPRPEGPARRENAADRSLRLPPNSKRLWIGLGVGAAVLLSCGCLPLFGGVAWMLIASGGSKPAARPIAVVQTKAAIPQPAAPNAPAVPVIDLDAQRNAVPQPAAADLARQREARRVHLLKTVWDSYDKVGKRNAKWDVEAHATLDETVKHLLYPEPDVSLETIGPRAKNAIDAGCDDPFIRYLYARFNPGPVKAADRLAAFERAAEGMRKSRYPAVWRGLALARFADVSLWPQYRPTRPQLDRSTELIHEAVDLLAEAARVKGAQGQRDAYNLYLEIMVAYDRMASRKIGYDRIADRFAKETDPQAKIFFLVVKGAFFTEYAWEARGTGWARDVTPEGWEGMRTRLAEAEAALEKAWELDSSNALAATNMLNVELGQGKGRDRFEQWFQRAMMADGDNFQACWRKLYYLQPKWHGSQEEAVAFGRACLATNNWDGGLPIILSLAHWTYNQERSVPQAAKDAYFQQSRVWEDGRTVWASYAKRFPQSALVLSNQLQFALRCKQEAEVDRQLRVIGDRLSPQVFNPQEITNLQARARALAAN